MSPISEKSQLKSKVLVLDSGERVVLIIDTKTAVPHLHLNRYLFHARKPVLQFNSLKKEADAICYIFNHGQRVFGDWAGYALLNKVSSAEIFEHWEVLKRSNHKEEVSRDTHMYRWDIFRRIFDYWTDQQILDASHNDPEFKNLALKKKILLNEIDRLRIRTSHNRLVGLEKVVLKEIIRISRIDSPDNPWIKRDRLRNQVIIDLFIRLGIRAGELLKISLPDLQLSSEFSKLKIQKVLNDKDDPRKKEPRVKTFGRILEIDPELSNSISRYLRERRLIPNAKRTKYLFVSHTSGMPISSDGIAVIIESLRSIESEVKITPHALRRTWNDLFREHAEELGFDSEIVTQTQNYLQGRMLNSNEALKYSAKFIERSAREAHMSFQKKLLEGAK